MDINSKINLNENYKRTKIIATIGPSTNSYDAIYRLIKAGANGLRLNFSHGTHQEKEQQINWIREASKELKKPVSIIQDLQGPKIRLGDFNGVIELSKNQVVVLGVNGDYLKDHVIPIQFDLTKKLKRGDRLFIFDGRVKGIVQSVKEKLIYLKIENGGQILSRKGINLPDTDLGSEVITSKDRADLVFGSIHDIDYVAQSFVQNVDNVRSLKKILTSLNSRAKVIVKFETKMATLNIPEIISEADGAMVARGDLGIEIPIKHLPIIQKKIITTSNNAGKPVITATQMLKSMVNYPMPTRAEVTDVVNAVLDGSDAVMLSEESAMGSYPIEAINMMYDLVNEGEKIINNDKFIVESTQYASDIENLISRMVVDTTKNIKVKAIIAPTSSGRTAQLISRFRLDIPIIAITRHDKTFKKLLLSWGVHPIKIDKEYINGIDEILDITALLAKHYRFKDGDNIIITGGYPLRGTPTNLLYIYKYSGKHT